MPALFIYPLPLSSLLLHTPSILILFPYTNGTVHSMTFKPSFIYPADAHKLAMRIALFYALAGAAWILLSDEFLRLFVIDPRHITWLQTAKGWFFVVFTAFLLFWLLRRSLTEVVRASRAAGELEERFQLLFQGTPVSIWELDLSSFKDELDYLMMMEKESFGTFLAEQPEYVRRLLGAVRVRDVNTTTLRLFGARSKEELIGALDRILVPQSLPAFRDALAAVAGGAGVVSAELYTLTLDGECKSLLVTASLPAEREKFDAVPVCVVDITERKEADERLRLLESAVEQTSEAITITTAELSPPGPRIVFVNQAFTRITGYEPREVLGQTPRILQGPKTDRDVLDRMKRELFQRKNFRGETVNYHKDGSEFIMEWFITPIVNRDFQVTHFVAIQRDITARRQGEEELLRRIAELEKGGRDR